MNIILLPSQPSRLFNLVAQARLPELEGVGGDASPSSNGGKAASLSLQGQAGPATAKGQAALAILRARGCVRSGW